MSSFQLEANKQQQEAESAASNLSRVRKMIAKLLKSINEVSFNLAGITLFCKIETSQIANQSKKNKKILLRILLSIKIAKRFDRKTIVIHSRKCLSIFPNVYIFLVYIVGV